MGSEMCIRDRLLDAVLEELLLRNRNPELLDVHRVVRGEVDLVLVHGGLAEVHLADAEGVVVVEDEFSCSGALLGGQVVELALVQQIVLPCLCERLLLLLGVSWRRGRDRADICGRSCRGYGYLRWLEFFRGRQFEV